VILPHPSPSPCPCPHARVPRNEKRRKGEKGQRGGATVRTLERSTLERSVSDDFEALIGAFEKGGWAQTSSEGALSGRALGEKRIRARETGHEKSEIRNPKSEIALGWGSPSPFFPFSPLQTAGECFRVTTFNVPTCNVLTNALPRRRNERPVPENDGVRSAP
jgi:hypothetical protein